MHLHVLVVFLLLLLLCCWSTCRDVTAAATASVHPSTSALRRTEVLMVASANEAARRGAEAAATLLASGVQRNLLEAVDGPQLASDSDMCTHAAAVDHAEAHPHAFAYNGTAARAVALLSPCQLASAVPTVAHAEAGTAAASTSVLGWYRWCVKRLSSDTGEPRHLNMTAVRDVARCVRNNWVAPQTASSRNTSVLAEWDAAFQALVRASSSQGHADSGHRGAEGASDTAGGTTASSIDVLRWVSASLVGGVEAPAARAHRLTPWWSAAAAAEVVGQAQCSQGRRLSVGVLSDPWIELNSTGAGCGVGVDIVELWRNSSLTARSVSALDAVLVSLPALSSTDAVARLVPLREAVGRVRSGSQLPQQPWVALCMEPLSRMGWAVLRPEVRQLFDGLATYSPLSDVPILYPVPSVAHLQTVVDSSAAAAAVAVSAEAELVSEAEPAPSTATRAAFVSSTVYKRSLRCRLAVQLLAAGVNIDGFGQLLRSDAAAAASVGGGGGGESEGGSPSTVSGRAGLLMETLAQYPLYLAIENALEPGYTTEKFWTGFLASAVPVYWGSALAPLLMPAPLEVQLVPREGGGGGGEGGSATLVRVQAYESWQGEATESQAGGGDVVVVTPARDTFMDMRAFESVQEAARFIAFLLAEGVEASLEGVSPLLDRYKWWRQGGAAGVAESGHHAPLWAGARALGWDSFVCRLGSFLAPRVCQDGGGGVSDS